MGLENAKMGPVRRLFCTCCGAVTSGRQWHSQDDGYGLCASCVDRCIASCVRDGQDPERVYGVRHWNFDLPTHSRVASITYDDGEVLVTRINGADSEIHAYYFGKEFIREDESGKETRRSVVKVSVEFDPWMSDMG